MVKMLGRWVVIAACALGGCTFTPGGTRATTGDDAVAASDGAVAADGRFADGALDAEGLDAGLDAAPIDAHVPTTPALVQQAVKFGMTGSPLTVALPGAPVAGHVLVMVGAANHFQLDGVSGGGVATWSRAARSNNNANVELWVGVTNGSSSSVSITLANNPGAIWMQVSEWSGLDTAALLDGAKAASGTTNPASAGSLTTTARDLVIFGVADLKASTLGTPTGGPWTAMTGIANASVTQAEFFQIVDAGTAVAPTITETRNMWDAAIAGLRIAP